MIGLAWLRAMQAVRRAGATRPTTQIHTRHSGTVIVDPTSHVFKGIYLDGGTVPVPAHYLTGYSPTDGDVVLVTNVGGDLVIHGKFAS